MISNQVYETHIKKFRYSDIMSFIDLTTMEGLLQEPTIEVLKSRKCSTLVYKTVWRFLVDKDKQDILRGIQHFKIKKELMDFIQKKEKISEHFLKNIQSISSSHISKMILHSGSFFNTMRLIRIIMFDKNIRYIYMNAFDRQHKFIGFGPYLHIRSHILQSA